MLVHDLEYGEVSGSARLIEAIGNLMEADLRVIQAP